MDYRQPRVQQLHSATTKPEQVSQARELLKLTQIIPHSRERKKNHEKTGSSAIPTHDKSHPSSEMFVDNQVE